MVEDLYSGGLVLIRCALLIPVMLVLSACTRPAEVFVTLNGEGWWLQQVSFRGCSWAGVLEAGESTTIGGCVEGVGPVSFQARPDPDWAVFDLDDEPDSDEPDSDEPDSDDVDSGDVPDPTGWRWYRTNERYPVKAGDVQQLVVVPEAWTELP